MPAAQHTVAQRDFSAGQLDVEIKRNDEHPLFKLGSRRAENTRVLNTRGLKNRPGRRPIYPQTGRVDRVRMSPTATYDLCFGTDGTLKIRDSAGAIVIARGGYPWTASTLQNINWDIYQNDIYVCYSGSSMQPQKLSWDGSSTWTINDYSPTVSPSGQIRTVFYRISTRGATLKTSAKTGSGVTVTASLPVFTSAAVGSYVRWLNCQILITAFTSTTVVTGTIIEQLPYTMVGAGFGSLQGAMSAGEIVVFGNGDEGEFVASSGGNFWVNMLVPGQTGAAGVCTGPNGHFTVSSMTQETVDTSKYVTYIWDDEVFNAYRGWPGSVFVDQNRLGFCDIPGAPSGIAWSAIGLTSDLYVGSNPEEAIFELAPNKSRVRYVMAGPESNEFVFCDNRIYYIEISVTNPLQPGSVAFSVLSGDGCAACQPRRVQEYLIYSSAGQISLNAVIATGAYRRPFETRALNEVHAALFDNPVAIAVPSAEAQFPERYVYALNEDGSIAVARLPSKQNQIELQEELGWVPWSGSGTVSWISAFEADTIFVTSYEPNDVSLAEEVDADEYLDGALHVNAVPAAMVAGTESDILIWPTVTTNIGNMTANGGLAAAFDGTTSQAAAACASRAATTGFVGKGFMTAQRIGSAKVWPSNNSGYATAETGNITVELRAAHAAPTLGTEGTQLASSTFADTTTGPLTLTSNDTTTAWEYVWVRISDGAPTNVYVAELQLYYPGRVNKASGGGTGDLWFVAGGSVDLIDSGTRTMGTYTVDASGDIVPQMNAGEDLTSSELVAGMSWTMTYEPFVPMLQPGQDVKQRLFRRQLAASTLYVMHSTGFYKADLFSGPIRPDGPDLGDEMNLQRIPAWQQGEDPTAVPPEREEGYQFRHSGASHDPRVHYVKDTPGPITILEWAAEVSA